MPLHILKAAAIMPRLRALYPNARIDVAPPTSASASEPAEAVRVDQASPRIVALAPERQIPGLRASVSGSSIVLVGPDDALEKAKTLAQTHDAPPFGSKCTQVYRLQTVDAGSVAGLIARSYPGLRVTTDKDLRCRFDRTAIPVFPATA